MLKLLARLFTSKWVTLLILYLGVLSVSYGYQVITQNFEPLSSKQKDFPGLPIVYIGDPIVTNPEIHNLDSLDVLFFDLKSESIRSNAQRLIQRIDSLGLERYHLVGEGIGGSVAMHAAVTDTSVLSLTLFNAHGIVELEQLGGEFLNQTVYRGKKAVYKLLKTVVPHFGTLNYLTEHIKKTEIQITSDQQLIREILKKVDIPVLILQTPDAAISDEIAMEHQRLLPQSELLFLESDVEVATSINEFQDRVLSGEATQRADVTMAAQIRSLQPFDPANSIKAEGKALIILMLVIIFSTFITEDLTCIGTGLLIARGMIGFITGTLACLIGIFIGDILLYLMGKWVAKGTLDKAPLKWFITEKDMQLSYHWFEAKGPAIIIASRFIPGSRFPTYVSAGAIGANFITFMLYFGIASILWTPILVGLAVVLGNEMIEYFTIYQDYALWALLALFATFFVLIKVIIPSLTYKGRRLLIGSFRRKINWEFWSPILLYAPVFVYLIGLWIKHKSITLVTMANPGIKFGGIVKESKSEILQSIQLKEMVAPFRLITPDKEAYNACKIFMEEHNLKFPVVLKPDAGERGREVVIPKNESELERFVSAFSVPFIIQKYVDGLEFGVFYVRYPHQKKGSIISITRKEYLWLTGNGEHTLEELILQDDRAVCMAKTHFEQHVDHLFKVIPKGKRIKLVEVGTHSRGAIFKDATYLNTPELVDSIDEVSKSIEGFYFGRFDIKVPDETHFAEGNSINVLELNGITSEATHMYDPKYPYWYAVKTLCEQWKIAYAIADEVKSTNRELTPPRLRDILKLLG